MAVAVDQRLNITAFRLARVWNRFRYASMRYLFVAGGKEPCRSEFEEALSLLREAATESFPAAATQKFHAAFQKSVDSIREVSGSVSVIQVRDQLIYVADVCANETLPASPLGHVPKVFDQLLRDVHQAIHHGFLEQLQSELLACIAESEGDDASVKNSYVLGEMVDGLARPCGDHRDLFTVVYLRADDPGEGNTRFRVVELGHCEQELTEREQTQISDPVLEQAFKNWGEAAPARIAATSDSRRIEPGVDSPIFEAPSSTEKIQPYAAVCSDTAAGNLWHFAPQSHPMTSLWCHDLVRNPSASSKWRYQDGEALSVWLDLICQGLSTKPFRIRAPFASEADQLKCGGALAVPPPCDDVDAYQCSAEQSPLIVEYTSYSWCGRLQANVRPSTENLQAVLKQVKRFLPERVGVEVDRALADLLNDDMFGSSPDVEQLAESIEFWGEVDSSTTFTYSAEARELRVGKTLVSANFGKGEPDAAQHRMAAAFNGRPLVACLDWFQVDEIEKRIDQNTVDAAFRGVRQFQVRVEQRTVCKDKSPDAAPSGESDAETTDSRDDAPAQSKSDVESSKGPSKAIAKRKECWIRVVPYLGF